MRHSSAMTPAPSGIRRSYFPRTSTGAKCGLREIHRFMNGVGWGGCGEGGKGKAEAGGQVERGHSHTHREGSYQCSRYLRDCGASHRCCVCAIARPRGRLRRWREWRPRSGACGWAGATRRPSPSWPPSCCSSMSARSRTSTSCSFPRCWVCARVRPVRYFPCPSSLAASSPSSPHIPLHWTSWLAPLTYPLSRYCG